VIPSLIALSQFKAFTLILFRLTGLFLVAPLFSSRDTPARVKLGLAALTAFLVFPLVPVSLTSLPRDLGGFTGFVLAELGVGITLGFATTLFFSAFQLAGQHIGQQMGLSLADIVDPFSETEVSLIGQFQFFLALAIYVAVGAHRWLLGAVAESFHAVPLGGFRATPQLIQLVSDAFGNLLGLSLQLAAPVLVALFLSTVALGFVARAVPQMNVLILSFPLQIGLGLGVILATLPAFARMILTLCETLTGDLSHLLAAMVPTHG
jgi:flagellar biosynthetic protein FliR